MLVLLGCFIIPTLIQAQIATVKTDDGWHLYDLENETITTETWDSLINLSPTRLGYMSNGKWGVMTPTAEPLTPAKYRFIQPFNAGMAAVHVGFNHWAYIDTNGQEVIKGPFRRAKPFKNAGGGMRLPDCGRGGQKGRGLHH